MSELENGPFVAKLVQPEDADEDVVDPLAYCSGRELGKFHDSVELTTLADQGTVHGRPSRATLDGAQLRSARKLNYKQVDTGTGFYSPVSLDTTEESYYTKTLPPERVIIGRMRPYLNNTTVLDPELLNGTAIATDSEWLLFEPDDGLLHYWGLVLRTENVLRQFSITRGQTRPRLHEDDLRRISVPVHDTETKERLNDLRMRQFRNLQRAEREITETESELDRALDEGGAV
jgi:hypothetical protein